MPEGESVRQRFLVSRTIEVEAATEDFAAAALAAQALWDAEGEAAHNERARHRACLSVEVIQDSVVPDLGLGGKAEADSVGPTIARPQEPPTPGHAGGSQ